MNIITKYAIVIFFLIYRDNGNSSMGYKQIDQKI